MTGRSEVRILVGIDGDRPRHPYLEKPDSTDEAQRVVEYLHDLFPSWDTAGATWTLFLCGAYVEALQTLKYIGTLRAAVHDASHACDVACHTYSHRPIARVPGRNDLLMLDDAELLADLQTNEELIRSAFELPEGRKFGFRAPYGTCMGGLKSSTVQVLSAKRAYSSSVLRSEINPLSPPLIENGVLRQPFQYASGLWELPSHGFHDTYFANLSGTQNLGRIGGTEAIKHYISLVQESVEIAASTSRTVFVGLVLHPLAMSLYDPGMQLLPTLLNCSTARVPVVATSYLDAVGRLTGGYDD
jgi:hypothetical protein